tara:strand:- start:17561 stop:18181 length:621 start_codon:yes stop_codon:yes gene_type:complete
MLNTTEYKKLRLSFRYWILGKAEENKYYFRVLKALNIAEKYHTGERKDGSPELIHQYSIVSYLRTIHKSFINPVDVFIVAILHDTYEDYPESEEELKKEFPDLFDYFVRISKVRNGEKISYQQYFGEMQECDVCSIVKLTDRIHNISTMIDVFSLEKQDKYLEEVDLYFFPMLKHAKRLFPEQENAYENLKSILTVLKETIKNIRQ